MKQIPTGEQIRKARIALGRNKTQMAKLIGCTYVSLNNWEKHGTTPQPKYRGKVIKLVEMARARGVDV